MTLDGIQELKRRHKEIWRSLYRQKTKISEIFDSPSSRRTILLIRHLWVKCDLYGENPYSSEYRTLSPTNRIKLLTAISPAAIRLANLLDAIDDETLEYLDHFMPRDSITTDSISAILRNLAESADVARPGVEQPVKGKKKNTQLHDWVESMAELYQRETGKRPSKPSISVRSRGRDAAVTGRFYSLCALALEIVDPQSVEKLPNVVEQVAKRWGKLEPKK